MTSRRLPAAIILLAIGVAAIVTLGPGSQADPPDSARPSLASASFVAPPDEALASTWFCAAGVVDAALEADHGVVIINPHPERVTGSLTAYGEDGALGGQILDLAAFSRSLIRLADLELGSPGHVAALIELNRGAMVVEHRVTTVGGDDHGRCATGTAGAWQFAHGVTEADAALELVLFNPFPDTASVDVVFDAEDGFRAPQALEGLVVPAETIRVVDVAEAVPLRAELIIRVQVRSGRVVADRVQSFDGSAGRTGIEVELGASGPALAWVFPGGVVGEDGSGAVIIVANPTDAPAEIELELVADPEQANPILVTRTVFAHRREVIELAGPDIGEPGTAFATTVRSFNEVPVLVERLVGGPGQALSSLGTTVMASRYVLASLGEQGAGLVVVNPSEEETSVSVEWLGPDGPEPIGSFDVAGGELVVHPLNHHSANPVGAVVVQADHPVQVDVVPGTGGPPVPVDGLVALTADF